MNYNPGASTAIGFSIGFLCTIGSIKFKRLLNAHGVIDSNSVIFHFLVPSFFAAMFSAIMQGVNMTSATFNSLRFSLGVVNNISQTYTSLR